MTTLKLLVQNLLVDLEMQQSCLLNERIVAFKDIQKDIMPFNRIIRKEGLIQHADPLTNHIGSGLLSRFRNGEPSSSWILSMSKYKIAGNHPLHVYLSQKKKEGERHIWIHTKGLEP